MNYFLSLLTGALISFMVFLNGTLSSATGNYASTVIIHFVGLLGIIVVMFFTKSKLTNLKGVPFYLYFGGFVGILTVLFNNVGYTHLGASLTLALSLFGQSVSSIIIDHFGLFGLPVIRFNHKKTVGLLIISIGIFLMTLS
ncbi:MAG: DMT family transporter [bacterium]|nr:DMT family transporter [bacterium]